MNDPRDLLGNISPSNSGSSESPSSHKGNSEAFRENGTVSALHDEELEEDFESLLDEAMLLEDLRSALSEVASSLDDLESALSKVESSLNDLDSALDEAGNIARR